VIQLHLNIAVVCCVSTDAEDIQSRPPAGIVLDTNLICLKAELCTCSAQIYKIQFHLSMAVVCYVSTVADYILFRTPTRIMLGTNLKTQKMHTA
jgi:hypothetical protein